MTSSVPKKFVGKGMADSMSSSVDDDDNSLDGRNSSQGDRSRSIDTSQVHLFPTVPKTEEKPRRRSSRPTYVSGDSVNHFTGSDPVRLELARLENELQGKATGRSY